MGFDYTNSRILNSQPGPMGFVIGNGEYAAISMMGSTTKLMVIHNGLQLKVCRNRQSAMSFIDKHRKRKS
jgi:hypothetical protein